MCSLKRTWMFSIKRSPKPLAQNRAVMVCLFRLLIVQVLWRLVSSKQAQMRHNKLSSRLIWSTMLLIILTSFPCKAPIFQQLRHKFNKLMSMFKARILKIQGLHPPQNWAPLLPNWADHRHHANKLHRLRTKIKRIRPQATIKLETSRKPPR